MADPQPQPQTLYQIIGPDGVVQPGAVQGPEWLHPGEKLGPQIDTTGRGLAPGLQPKAPEAQPKEQPASGWSIIPRAAAAEPQPMDLTQFGLVASQPSGQQPQQGAVSAPMDLTQFGLTPAQKSQAQPQLTVPSAQAAATTMDWSKFPETFAGSLAATLGGIPRGLLGGRTIDVGNALMQTPLRMITGWQNPQAAFEEGLRREQQTNQQLQSAYPYASLGGQVTGGLAGGAMMAPGLGWQRAAGFLPNIGTAASYLARNMGLGGAMSYLSGADTPGEIAGGAALGGLLPAAHVAGSAATAPFGWAARQLPQIFSPSAQQAAVGRTLAERVGGAPVQTSPVGPLSLTQATGSPTIAAYGDVAPAFNAEANARLLQAQQEAINAQIAKVGTPVAAPDAAAKLTNTIRAAEGVADQQENALWNVPELKQATVQTSWLKNSMHDAVNKLAPGLRLGVTGSIKSALDLMDNMPQQATVGDINSIRTALRLAGRPTESNPWAPAVSNQLQTAFLDAMDRTLGTSTADPAIMSAWQAARNFTRTLRTGPLATRAMQTVLNEKNAASAASRSLFNFSYGSPEGPRSITDLAAFTKALNDPTAKPLAQDMIAAARSYLATGMQAAGRLEPGQNMNPKLLQDFIRDNEGWMQKSGILNASQKRAVDELSSYVDMLRRPEQLLRQVNSATQPRTARQATFIDEIMTPWARHLISLAGIALGAEHGHGMGALAGTAAATAFEKGVTSAEASMRELMAQALLNPRVARDLMMKANAGNRALLSPPTRQLLDTLRAAIGSDVLPQLNAPALPAPSPALAQ